MLTTGLDVRPRSRGTVLMLMPAAMLVMLVLAAIVLDLGLTAVRARELRAVAASAANDSLAALDIDMLRADNELVLDEARAREVIVEAVSRGPLPDAVIDEIRVGIDALGRIEITVRLTLDVDLIIAPALPGAPDHVRVTAVERVLIVS